MPRIRERSHGIKTYVFEIELEQEEDGRWSATIPGLPGCATWGYTREEALENLKEEAKAFLEVLFEGERTLPREAEDKVTVIPSPAIAITL
ncbi:MAG TPA: type II toxin-antitoxin system HicB family antitoxin [Dehalococcoidia bacterium]|nr:type II toxin-antitoxin system HicB family antitoxin [Dehalococcoidia bacterium]